MSRRYSEEFKEQTVRKMMPPNAQTVAQIHRDTGVSEPTLYAWREQYRAKGLAVPADPANPKTWRGRDKLAVVIESAALNETDLAAYCRRKGLYPEQIAQWREVAELSNDPQGQQPLTKAERRELAAERKKSRLLEKDLARKDKALAEAAALLVLRKKAQAIWGESAGD